MAAPSVLQHKKGTNSGSTTVTVSLTSNVTAGNMLVAWCMASASVTINTPTMTGETFVKQTGASKVGTTSQVACYTVNSAAGGHSSVTFTTSAVADLHFHVQEISGQIASPIDATGNAETTTATATVSTSSATSTATDLVIAFFADEDNGPTISAGSGYTQIDFSNLSGAAGDSALSESATTSATGTQTATATGFNGTDHVAMGILAIAGTGGGVAVLAASWHETDSDLVFRSDSFSGHMWDEDFGQPLVKGAPTTPVLAWDEVDWQRSFDVRVSELITQDEQPTEIPPVVVVWNPALAYTQGDDWDWSKNADVYSLQAQFEHEDWNNTLSTPFFYFDEFEDQYVSIFRPEVYRAQQPEDEQPTNLPIIPVTLLQTQFDDWDWSQRFDLKYAPVTQEEDTGLQVIFIPLPTDEGLDQKFFALYIVPPQHPYDEDWSVQANFPPPPVPVQERNDETPWQKNFDYRLSQATAEEDVVLSPKALIPTAAWDEVDWQRYFAHLYGTPMQQEQMEDQTLGWFLNPPVPPPPPFCPLPPFGPDGDVAMSIFGGAFQPLQVLFCRICKSGRPLIIRADYAIWCQDCCAFVSKQDTYMGTVRAPGQLKGIF